MPTPLEQQLTQLATDALAAHGLVLVSARLSGSGRFLTLQVMAENPDGSSPGLDDCARASRTLSAQLDVADIIKSRYVLEVGSPGLERPLNNAADYQRFIGRGAKVAFSTPQQVGKQSLGAVTGVLTAADQHGFTVHPQGYDAVTFPYHVVRSAHLQPTPEELAMVMKHQPLPGDVTPAHADEDETPVSPEINA